MRRVRTSLLLCLLCGLSACAAAQGFRARFSDRPDAWRFGCEVQKLHRDSTVRIKDVPREAAPGAKAIVLEPGAETVAWLYHLEPGRDAFAGDGSAYTIAVSIKRPEPGLHELPSGGASVVFFCDRWGGGFLAAEARATRGWLRVREISDRVMRGELDVTVEGYKERADKTREPAVLYLEGAFDASR